MAIRRPSDKNTKAEILSAFDDLLKQKKTLELQLETQLAQKPIAPTPTPPSNGKAAVLAKPPGTGIAPPKPQQKMASIIEGLNLLQLNFGGAVSDLSEKLTLEALNLQEIQTQVAAETEQLEALHSLEATTELDDLIQQYEESAKTFNTEFEQQRETVDLELTEARKTWVKEQEDYQRTVKERNETLVKARQRDAKEYLYDLNLGRKLTDEEYEQEKGRLYQELEDLQQIQEKVWTEREKTIATRETEFAALKAKVEAAPRDLEVAIKRSKEEGKGIAYQQAKIKSDLFAKEVEGSQRTYDLRIQALQESIDTQDTRIQALAKQLDAALKQVQDLAVKAIEGASNVNSFEAVKEIAIEQAKNLNKNK
jgi:hypothetical protein